MSRIVPDKISKPSALYFGPAQIGDAAGARCGICKDYIRQGGLCAKVSGKVDPFRGVCGIYSYGAPLETGVPGNIPKEMVGYVENGPSHCQNCEYMGDRELPKSPCELVEGMVDGLGCCSLWEKEPGADVIDVPFEKLGL